MTFSEIALTIVVIWILFRIFRRDGPRQSNSFTFHSNFQRQQPNKERDTTVQQDGKPKKKNGEIDGEYVDYEEIK